MLSFIGDIIALIIVSGLAGWLSGLFIKKRGFGLIGNLIIGGCGSLLGSLIFSIVGFSYNGFFANLIVAFIGSCIIVYLIKQFLPSIHISTKL